MASQLGGHTNTTYYIDPYYAHMDQKQNIKFI